MSDVPDIAFEHMGPLQGDKIDLSEIEGSHHHDKYESEDAAPEGGVPDIQTQAFAGNEFDVSYVKAEPGQTIAWHNHAPNLYQVYIPLEGRLELSYYDGDGDRRTTEATAGELLYLPPGATNKIEAVGDEALRFLAVERGVTVKRVDQVLAEYADDEYDPYEDPDAALAIDTLRGEVRELNDSAVGPY